MNNIDIAIIGAGSAGSIIANKLLNETNFNIVLIEAGPKDNNPIIDVPLGYGMTFYNKKINWNFYSEKQDNLFDRQIYYPRGKVLGGSGSINAMVYARGLETDYENWGKSKEWSFENIKLKSTPKISLKPSHTIILRYTDNKTKKSYDIDSWKPSQNK